MLITSPLFGDYYVLNTFLRILRVLSNLISITICKHFYDGSFQRRKVRYHLAQNHTGSGEPTI